MTHENKYLKGREERLCDLILKEFPKFFDDYYGWEDTKGNPVGFRFRRIYNLAKRNKEKIDDTKRN